MRYGFIITHIGSGGDSLCQILANSLSIHCSGHNGIVYDHPSSLDILNQRFEQRKSTKDWCIDELLHNYEFSCKSLYKYCKFIYMLRSPLMPLSILVRDYKFSEKGAENYYLFRLRRMCEMVKKTGGIVITYEDLVSKDVLQSIQKFLSLKSPLVYESSSHEDSLEISKDVLERCFVGYNRYLKFMRN